MQIDNRIILALSKVTGEEKRNLDNIFVFKKAGEVTFFATNGRVSLAVRPTQGEFDFDGEDGAYILPSILKKIVVYKKKEENATLNSTIFSFADGYCTCQVFNGWPFEIKYKLPSDTQFRQVPDIFNYKAVEKSAVAMWPENLKKLGDALDTLGLGVPVFLCDDAGRFQGTGINDDFEVRYCIQGVNANV